MSNFNRKVEFLNRLFKLASCYEDLVNFLRSEKALSDFELDTLKNESDKARYLIIHLERIRSEEKLLLLDYEWLVLPVERLKMTLVTERVSKEFVWNF